MRAAVCVDSLSSLNTQLRESFKERTDLGQFSEDVHSIRSPVCLLFVRPPSDLKEVKQTFDYWDFSSDTAIDIALPGWNTDRMYLAKSYTDFEKELEEISKWRRSASPNILLLDFIYDINFTKIQLDYSRCIILPVSNMIFDKNIVSLDSLMTEIVYQASKRKGSVWEISYGLAINAGSKNLLNWLVSGGLVKSLPKIFSGLKPYVICDFRKKKLLFTQRRCTINCTPILFSS